MTLIFSWTIFPNIKIGFNSYFMPPKTIGIKIIIRKLIQKTELLIPEMEESQQLKCNFSAFWRGMMILCWNKCPWNLVIDPSLPHKIS